MKRTLSVQLILLVLVITAQLSFAGSFDGVGTDLQPGKVSLSVGYWYQEDKLKGDDWRVSLVQPSPGPFEDEDIAAFGDDLKIKSNQAFVQASVGLFKGWEAYMRVGGADFRTSLEEVNLSDSSKFFWAVGVNGSLYRDKRFAFGPFAQFTQYDRYKDTVVDRDGDYHTTAQVTLKDYYSIRAGLVGSVTIADNVAIYGGPFWNHVRAKLTIDGTTVNSAAASVDEIVSIDNKLKNRDEFGGVLGFRVPVTKTVSIGAEGQFTSRWAAGARINFSF